MCLDPYGSGGDGSITTRPTGQKKGGQSAPKPTQPAKSK
jgi:hypothetical protein